jgi:hypothetical protein
MAMTINMVRSTTSDTTARNMTMSQVNQAASWIARDIESASVVTPTVTGESVLCRMTRYVWSDTGMTTQGIVYEVTGQTLLRKLGGSAVGTPVAQFIKYPGTYTAVTSAGSNTYIIKLRSEYSNGEYYQQQFKVSQRAPP